MDFRKWVTAFILCALALPAQVRWLYNPFTKQLDMVGGGSTPPSGYVKGGASLSTGLVPFGSGTTDTITTDSTFIWDNTNKRLGLGQSSPSFRLDTSGMRCFDPTSVTGSTLCVFQAGAGQSTTPLVYWLNNNGTTGIQHRVDGATALRTIQWPDIAGTVVVNPDPTGTSAVVLPELAANGNNSVWITGADSQGNDTCYIMPALMGTGLGDSLVDAGTTTSVTVNGVTRTNCRTLEWDSPSTFASFSDDFQHAEQWDGTLLHGWNRTNNPTTAFSASNLDANHPGILRLTNSSSTWGTIDWQKDAAMISNPTATTNWEMRWIFRVGGLTSATYRLGYYDTAGANPANWVGLIYESGTDTNWQCAMRAASGSTNRSDTGVAAATTNWVTLRLRSIAAGTVRCSVAINGGSFSSEKTICASGCDIAATMPTTAMAPFFQLYHASATTTADVDFFSYRAKVTR